MIYHSLEVVGTSNQQSPPPFHAENLWGPPANEHPKASIVLAAEESPAEGTAPASSYDPAWFLHEPGAPIIMGPLQFFTCDMYRRAAARWKDGQWPPFD